MDVRGQVGGPEVDDRQGAGHPVVVHRLVALRWGAPVTVGPCPVTAVPMAAVRPTPKPDVIAAVIATDAARGMADGSGRGMAIDPVTGSEIAHQIDPESALGIAPESASGIAPAPSTGIKTTDQGQHGFAIATIEMIDTATAVVLEMNGVSRPSVPVRVTTRAVPSGPMQHRRPQQPPPQRTI